MVSELNDALSSIADFFHPQMVVQGRGRAGRPVFTPEHITRSTFVAMQVRGVGVNWRSLVHDVLALYVDPELLGDAIAEHVREAQQQQAAPEQAAKL